MTFPTPTSIALAACLIAVTSIQAQPAKTKKTELTPTEKWVAVKVREGEMADLTSPEFKSQFPNEKDRELNATFLQDMLLGALPAIKPHRHGVRITGAIFKKPIDLTNAAILCEVWLDHCQFEENAIFQGASFAQVLSFEGTTFKGDANFTSVRIQSAIFYNAEFEGALGFDSTNIAANFDGRGIKCKNKEKSANFDGMKVGRNAHFDQAIFEGPVNFIAAEIGGGFSLDEAQFNNEEQTASFNTMKVGSGAFFCKAVFAGPANFEAAEIGVNFDARQVQFRNATKEADFDGMKVGHDANLTDAMFAGPAFFSSTDVRGNFVASDTRFDNKETSVSFVDLRVGRGAYFNRAVFEAKVDFNSADIGGVFMVDEAQFKNVGEGASFNTIKIGSSAFLRKAVFEGPVNFVVADIGITFDAQEAHFRDEYKGVEFGGMKIGMDARFDKAIFEGPVTFGTAEVRGDLTTDEAQFRCESQPVWLTMKCGGTGYFRGTIFAGQALFIDSSFLDLEIREQAGAPPVPYLDLSRSSIKRQLRIGPITIQYLVAQTMHVEGPADFSGAHVTNTANLSYADFASLDVRDSSWPEEASAFQMQGLSYKFIRAALDLRESREALLKFVDQADYTADAYGNLEAFFLRQGYSEDADGVFIAGKQRERKYLHGLAWLGSWSLDWLVGYGRHPWLAGIPCAFFVILGCFLFWPSKMDVQKKEDSNRVYNPFWYSLSLFVPFVDLQSHTVWKPKDDRGFLRHYMRIHALLGWILIPILLAAISGLIK